MIGIPCARYVEPETQESVYNMDVGGNDTTLRVISGYDVDDARMKIAELAREGRFDYVLMVDSDVVVPEDALVNLLSHGVDFAMGFYARRDKHDGTTCAFKTGRANYDRHYNASEFRDMRESGEFLHEVKGGGLGCALIKTTVFDRTRFPWFRWVVYPDGHGKLSEDLFFSEECHNSGIPVYVDTRVACKHMFRHFESVE